MVLARCSLRNCGSEGHWATPMHRDAWFTSIVVHGSMQVADISGPFLRYTEPCR